MRDTPKIDLTNGQLKPESQVLRSLVLDTDTGQVIANDEDQMPVTITINDGGTWTLASIDNLRLRCSPFHAGAIVGECHDLGVDSEQ